MSVIRILPENVASQIAAGEVVERPASVVRELLDNAIDAGAERIQIHLENGGKSCVKVTDNGGGMSRDDLLLCLERHATSKIETLDDLFSIKSLGFRGEALPSIASVSRMEITSRPREELVGYRLKVSGGKLVSIDETGAPPGTIVEVRSLFFNTPVRRKFLRAARTEADHVIDTLSRAALPFCGITFRLEEAGKPILNLPASSDELSRVSALMGRKVAESMTRIEEKRGTIHIRGLLADTQYDRTRGDRMFVYVNGRNIRDRLVTRAIMEGYGQRLMKGRYPVVVLFVEMDPAKIDINVHPTKQEVRFHDSRDLYQSVVSSIEKALSRKPHHLFARGSTIEPDRSRIFQQEHFVREPAERYSPVERVSEAAELAAKPMIRAGAEIIGQLGKTYILCQTEEGLLMVDQHAAHERVVYEALKKGVHRSQMAVQSLLIPHKVELNTRETRIALEKGEELRPFGIELDHFGGNTFVLRAVPALLKNVNWDAFISELVEGLSEGEKERESRVDKVLTVMACHGAIRAGQRLTREEMTHLMSQLEEADVPTNCPHGRPIFKKLSFYEIEKMFKRVV